MTEANDLLESVSKENIVLIESIVLQNDHLCESEDKIQSDALALKYLIACQRKEWDLDN